MPSRVMSHTFSESYFPTTPVIEYSGVYSGPLKWQGNVGLSWNEVHGPRAGNAHITIRICVLARLRRAHDRGGDSQSRFGHDSRVRSIMMYSRLAYERGYRIGARLAVLDRN